MRPRALVYGDVDLNIIDGSAIWAQGMVQALVRAGCEVTLVLKAPVRTGRLVDPLRGLPGVTVRHAGAQVRAFPPGPVSDVPPQLAKLQVAGLDLAHAQEAAPPPEPPYAVIALNPDVTMTTGKAAAQCGHAAQLLLRQGRRRHVAAWIEAGAPVHLARDVPWDRCVKEAAVAVRDGGFTEVPPGTMTAIAWLVRK
ncbi:hypothetical protein GCM10023178_56080 [Actinomadura luteofluorescens]